MTTDDQGPIDAEPARPRWQPGSDPTVAELVGDQFGEQAVARSVDPLLGGVYALAATIGLRAATPAWRRPWTAAPPRLTDAVRQGLPPATGAPVFGALDGGYQVLIDQLVERRRPRWVQATVDRLERAGRGWTLLDDTGAQWHADGVVLAVPAPRVRAGGESPRAPSPPRAGSVVVVGGGGAGSAGHTPFSECSGVLVASGEALRAKAVRRRRAGRGYPATHPFLRLSFGRAGEHVAASDDELLSWSIGDLQTVFGLDVELVDARVRRWIDAMPQYGPGHADLVAEVRAGLPPTLAVPAARRRDRRPGACRGGGPRG